MTEVPCFSFRPDLGSSIAFVTHTGTPPTASAILTVPSNVNWAA